MFFIYILINFFFFDFTNFGKLYIRFMQLPRCYFCIFAETRHLGYLFIVLFKSCDAKRVTVLKNIRKFDPFFIPIG